MSDKLLTDSYINLLCGIETTPADEPVNATTPLIGACLSCTRSLPWPAPQAGEWASPMACPKCGRWYFSQCRNRTALQVVEGDTHQGRPSRSEVADSFGADQTPASPTLLERLAVAGSAPADRRREERHEVRRRVVVVPLDAAVSATGTALDMTLVNLSLRGAELQGAAPVESASLLIDFTYAGCPATQLIARVCWNRRGHDVYCVGCEFYNAPGEALPLRE